MLKSDSHFFIATAITKVNSSGSQIAGCNLFYPTYRIKNKLFPARRLKSDGFGNVHRKRNTIAVRTVTVSNNLENIVKWVS